MPKRSARSKNPKAAGISRAAPIFDTECRLRRGSAACGGLGSPLLLLCYRWFRSTPHVAFPPRELSTARPSIVLWEDGFWEVVPRKNTTFSLTKMRLQPSQWGSLGLGIVKTKNCLSLQNKRNIYRSNRSGSEWLFILFGLFYHPMYLLFSASPAPTPP